MAAEIDSYAGRKLGGWRGGAGKRRCVLRFDRSTVMVEPRVCGFST
jgi:hypothetical protein